MFAPSLNNLRTIQHYNSAMANVIRVQLADLNTTNQANNGISPTLYNATLTKELVQLNTNLTNRLNTKKYGAINEYDMMLLLKVRCPAGFCTLCAGSASSRVGKAAQCCDSAVIVLTSSARI